MVSSLRIKNRYISYMRGGSDFMHSFYASTVAGGPPAISKALLSGINQAPMFNPLSASAVVPGVVSTGIVPSGLYLASLAGGGGQKAGGCPGDPIGKAAKTTSKAPSSKKAKASKDQVGGMSTAQLRTKCNQHGISCMTAGGRYKSRNTMINQLQKQL
jgi:hypothetical protein